MGAASIVACSRAARVPPSKWRELSFLGLAPRDEAVCPSGHTQSCGEIPPPHGWRGWLLHDLLAMLILISGAKPMGNSGSL